MAHFIKHNAWVIVLCTTLVLPSFVHAGFEECGSAAIRLKEQVQDSILIESAYLEAQAQYEVKKNEGATARYFYESACGYSNKDTESACGPYGYERRQINSVLKDLESAMLATSNAKTRLEESTSEVKAYAARVAKRCDAASSEMEGFYRSLIKELRADLNYTRADLETCRKESLIKE
jgi:hypothetical protein